MTPPTDRRPRSVLPATIGIIILVVSARAEEPTGEEFFEKQAGRFAESLAEDVRPPAEVRVVVDPYSRQAFLAIERTIRSILSF